MVLLRILTIILFLFPLVTQSQVKFRKSRAKIKQKNGKNRVRFIRLNTNEGPSRIFLKNVSENPEQNLEWDVFPEPEGAIKLAPSAQSSYFSGFADLGQQNVEIELIDEHAPLWRLATPADTAFLGKFVQGKTVKAELYKTYHSVKQGMNSPNSARNVAVRLASFKKIKARLI